MKTITLPWPALIALCVVSCQEEGDSRDGADTTGTGTPTLTTSAPTSGADTGPGSDGQDGSSATTTGGGSATSTGACADRPEGAYGDCVAEGDSACGDAEASCLVDDEDAPRYGVCNRDCTDACDCWAAPDSGDATPACKDVADAGTVCVLDCSEDKVCPDGMKCLVGPNICVFETGGGGTDTATDTDTGGTGSTAATTTGADTTTTGATTTGATTTGAGTSSATGTTGTTGITTGTATSTTTGT